MPPKPLNSRKSVLRGPKLWNEVNFAGPALFYVLPVVILGWVLERWLLRYSNVVPVVFGIWATIRYCKFQQMRAIEQLNNKWERHILNCANSTPVETSQWVNKLLLAIWPNYMEPKMVKQLVAQVQNVLREKRPAAIQSIEIQEFSLGTAPPVIGMHRSFWATDTNAAVALHTEFKFDSDQMSIVLAAKLGGPLKGQVARITVNSVFVKGELRIEPILDGQAVLYSFVERPEVRVGVTLAGPYVSVATNELPGVATWLERVLVDTLAKKMVEPRRQIKCLPVTKLGKSPIAAAVQVTIVSAQDLSVVSSLQSPDGPSDRRWSSTRRTSGEARELNPFVEISLDKLSRRTKISKGSNPVWNESVDLALHGSSATLRLGAYDAGSSSARCDPMGMAEIRVKYVEDDSTIFYAIGHNQSVIATRVERCGQETKLTIPLEENPLSQITVSLVIKEWQFKDGSRNIPLYEPTRLTPGVSLSAVSELTGRTVRVTVLEGRDLQPMDRTGFSDPYLKLMYGRITRKTTMVRQDLNPKWNEAFEFQELGGGEFLRIKCYDADKFGSEAMGNARVNLQGLIEGSPKDVWVPLEKAKHGEIRLKLEVFGPDYELQKEAEATAVPKSQAAGPATLEVTLVEARNLVAADWRGTSDPYVSVRYGNVKRRTKVIYKTLAPVWNQTLDFTEDGSSLILNVKDYNTLMASSAIGHCEIKLEGLKDGKPRDEWIPLKGVDKGEIHVQIRRRLPGTAEQAQEMASPLRKPESVAAAKLRLQASKIRTLIAKAVSLADEEASEDVKILMEELDQAEDEREVLIMQLQKDRDTLLSKIKELELVMTGLGA